MLLGLLLRLGSWGKPPLNLGETLRFRHSEPFEIPVAWWWKIPLTDLLRATANHEKRVVWVLGGGEGRFMQHMSGHIDSAFALVSLESTAFQWVMPTGSALTEKRGRENAALVTLPTVCRNVTWPRWRHQVLHRKKATPSPQPGVGWGALENRM